MLLLISPLFIPLPSINNDREEDCQSQLKMFFIYKQFCYNMFLLEQAIIR